MGIETILILGVMAISAIVSYVLAEQAQDSAAALSDADSQTLGDINVTQQKEGVVVPVIYGSVTLAGNIMWWDAENVNDQFYRFKMWQAICMGEIYNKKTPKTSGDELLGYNTDYCVWIDQKPASFYNLQYALIPVAGDVMDLNVPAHQIQDGVDNVSPNAGLLISPPGLVYATRLKGIAHIFLGSYKDHITGKYINSPIELNQGVTNISTYKYFVKRKLSTPLPRIEIGRGNNPASIIYDLLNNNQYGGDIDAEHINADNFAEASHYFYSYNMGLCFIINKVVKIKDIISKIQEWTDSFLIKDENNKYAIKILKDTDAETPTAIITDEKMIKFTLRRKSWEETFNSFTANFKPVTQDSQDFAKILDPVGDIVWSESYLKNDEVRTLTLKNEANIYQTGNERNKIIDLTGFNREDAVNYRLSQIMKKESYPFANATLTTNLEYTYLKLGDVVTIDSDDYNICTPFRILGIGYQKIDSNMLEFDLLQMREIIANESYRNAANPRGTSLRAVTPPCLENLTFAPFDSISSPLSYHFINDNKSVVYWGSDQLVSGKLTYDTDYTVVDHNKIQLDETIFADEILFNAAGLLNIDVFEEGCPSIES